MLTKENVLRVVKALPETFSLDELVDRMALLEKIQSGMQQSENGNVLSTEAAKKKLKKWL